MVVGYKGFPAIPAVGGFRLGTASAGIKKPGRRDLVVMELAPESSVAAVFTRNAFCAAPVIVAREHLSSGTPRYLLVNTGNANAGTGRRGLADARQCCEALAAMVGCPHEQVLPFSTGVIGEPLPVERLVGALPDAVGALSADGWEEAANGILTTDTVPKGSFRSVTLGGRTVTIAGISKGSGMIRPDMATMLAFVTTDAAVPGNELRRWLAAAVDKSFNRITVDGDTSTNDACVLVATGAAGVEPQGDEEVSAFCAALEEVCTELAQAIVRDGEGATRFISIEVSGGRDGGECRRVAETIAHSPLVKTALFAGDPNWGRILAAVGRAGVSDLELDAVTIHLDDVCIVSAGGRAETYREEDGLRVVQQEEYAIRVDLGRGDAAETVWTCDLSYDYVRINAEYRT